MAKSRCDNCQKIWRDEKLEEVKDYSMRVTPGGIVPSGECPKCGALCFPLKKFRVRVQRHVTQELTITIEANDAEEARGIALATAGDHDFAGTEKDAKYTIESIMS